MAETTLSAFAMLLLSLLPVLFLIFILRRRRRRYNLPPSGTRPLPIIGHLHLLFKSKPVHQTLSGMSDRYGPVLLLRFGSRPALIVSSPSAAEECFTKNDVAFANRPHGILVWERLSYDNNHFVTAPYGAQWRELRRFSMVELFSSAKNSALSPLRAREVRHLLRKLFAASEKEASGEGYRQVNMDVEFSELTMDMMMQTIAGKRYNEESGIEGQEERHRFLRVINETFYMFGKSNPRDFVPLLKWLGICTIKKTLARLEREVDDLLQNIVDDGRRHLEEARGGDEKKKPMLDLLLSLQEKDPEYYTDVLIKGLILGFIFAGTDTSAATMEWALSLLIKHPEIQEKVYAEIDAHVGHERLLVESDLANLPYLQNVVKETLRLFPAGPLLVPHQSTTDCTVAGYDIPGGTMLFVNAYAIHRDPNLWDSPLLFKPERFEGDEEAKGFKYIPFGYGRRGCPGESMAKRVVPLALGVLIQCFEWERVGEEDVDMTEGLGLTMPRAVPLEARYKPRQVMINILSQL